MKRGLVVVLVFALLAIVPARSNPPGRSWERASSSVIFSHPLHVTQNEIECVTCHPDAAMSRSSGDRLFPAMDACAACHDVEDEDACGTCHRDRENPEASPHPERPIAFSHKDHLDRGAECARCHAGVMAAPDEQASALPAMATCMSCHDGLTAANDCKLCHGDRVTLADIHPGDWRHAHGDVAAHGDASCAGCHTRSSTCLECHRGDNLTGFTHDLNYAFTHGLDAAGKETTCAGCHETRLFCTDCHERNSRIPLDHSRIAWLSEHGREARSDVERCASCHDSGDPTCARAGCHSDFDGVRGTDQAIHDRDAGRFDRQGPWHNDAGYFCFQCHVSTGSPGTGFCGYCHGS